MKDKDPMSAIYKILDEAGLNGGTMLTTRKPMLKMINTMRGEIANKIKQYIETREKEL